jgi:hypothetical protein
MGFRFLLAGVSLLLVGALQQPQRPKTTSSMSRSRAASSSNSLASTTAATATLLETATSSTVVQIPTTSTRTPADTAYSLPVPPPTFELPLWKLALAGSLATMVADMSMHPMDCIKTLQQSDQGMGLTVPQAAQWIGAQAGLAGFYKGFGTYAVCDSIGGALKFTTFELGKRKLQPFLSQGATKNAVLFACAGVAFVASSVITVPGELLKQQLQMGHYDGLWEATTSIWQTQGVAGFYQGYEGVFLRDVPYTAMELGLYEMLKNNFCSLQQQLQKESTAAPTAATTTSLGPSMEILAAGLTGAIVGLLTTPLDTIKTKMMVDSDYMGCSFWDTLMLTVQDHGASSVWVGSLARVAWLLPATAIYLPTYDFLKREFTKKERGVVDDDDEVDNNKNNE